MPNEENLYKFFELNTWRCFFFIFFFTRFIVTKIYHQIGRRWSRAHKTHLFICDIITKIISRIIMNSPHESDKWFYWKMIDQYNYQMDKSQREENKKIKKIKTRRDHYSNTPILCSHYCVWFEFRRRKKRISEKLHSKWFGVWTQESN